MTRRGPALNLHSPSPFPPGSLVWTYLRYSTEDQNLDSQQSFVEAWCADHQLVLGRTFVDEARTGTTTAGRDQFNLMMELLHDPALSPRPLGLVLWNSARFSRDIDDAQYFKSSLRHRKYVLHFLSDNIPAGREGRVIEAVIDYNNAKEAADRSREAQRGLRDRAAQGYNTGGFPPRGYRRSAPISLGRKLNGDERVAYKWEIDPQWETKVREAWSMRLAGAGIWEIHRALGLFGSVGSYTTFFRNRTYAGVRKCGELLVPQAHAAYVTEQEFERVQRQGRLTPGNPRAPDGDPQHSRRARSPFLLSGILFCGLCGAAMVGDYNRAEPCYRCGRRQRQGAASCGQKKIVAWYLEEAVTGWIAEHALTPAFFMIYRDKLNAWVSGDRSELLARQAQLVRDQKRVDREAHHLVDSLKVGGLTELLQTAIRETDAAMRRLESELAQVEAALAQGRLEISDRALAYLAEQQRDELLRGEPAQARAVIRQTVSRVALGTEQLTLKYRAPVQVMAGAIEGIKGVPPREYSVNPCLWQGLPEETATLAFGRPPTGHASPRYRVSH